MFLNFYTIFAIAEFDSTISVGVTLARYPRVDGLVCYTLWGGGGGGAGWWADREHILDWRKETDVDVSARLLIKLRRGMTHLHL